MYAVSVSEREGTELNYFFNFLPVLLIPNFLPVPLVPSDCQLITLQDAPLLAYSFSAAQCGHRIETQHVGSCLFPFGTLSISFWAFISPAGCHCWACLARQCGWKQALEGNTSEMTGGIKATI